MVLAVMKLTIALGSTIIYPVGSYVYTDQPNQGVYV